MHRQCTAIPSETRYDIVFHISKKRIKKCQKKDVIQFKSYRKSYESVGLLFIIVADEVDSELLAKVLANPEMWAFLNSLAKTMK